MIKICLLFAVAYAVATNLVPRTNLISWVDIATNDVFQGISLRKIRNGYQITWLEDVDEHTNPLGVYLNYIFEKSGNREIIDVPNLCGKYENGTLAFAVRTHILTQFANTRRCPIKKGTRAIYRVPRPYTYMTRNHECGVVDGSFYIFKARTIVGDPTPMLLRIHFRGNDTGPECPNEDEVIIGE